MVCRATNQSAPHRRPRRDLLHYHGGVHTSYRVPASDPCSLTHVLQLDASRRDTGMARNKGSKRRAPWAVVVGFGWVSGGGDGDDGGRLN